MMNKKLYVGNLLYEITDDQLRDHFSQAGTVASVQVIRFADSGRSKGFGFVEMATEEEAQRALEMFNEQDFQGRKMIVNVARPQGERKPRFGGGGQGGDRRGGGGDRHGGGRGHGSFGRDNNNTAYDFNRPDYGQPQDENME